MEDGLLGLTFEGVTLAQVAEGLSRPGPLPDRPVVDRTGLSGIFDLDLGMGLLPAAAVLSLHPEFGPLLRPTGVRSIFTALRDQAGLELVEATAPADALVIDRLDRPTVP
jgi:uncharacterized protein (TIGR03435 family)